MHVAVIGAGIVGSCTAAWLQRDGHRVTIVDPRDAGDACSFGNAGSLSPSACLPVGMPGIWRNLPTWLLDPLGPLTVRWSYLPVALPWLVRLLRHSSRPGVERIAGALRGLLAPIFDCYEPLLAHAQAQSLVRRTGCLYVFSSGETAGRWQWGMNLRRSLGVELQDIERGELEALEPDLKGRFRFGILAPENGSTVDPQALVRAIHARCLLDGAVHRRQAVRDIEPARPAGGRSGRVDTLLLDDGSRLPVDGVVLCAGAWSRRLARRVGIDAPLESQRGYHVTVASANLSLRHTVMAVEHNLMVNPMAMGLRLAGSVEFAGLDAPPDYRRAQALLDKGKELFPHLDTTRTSQWMGHRPCMPDSVPVVGPAPNHPGLWLAVGHGHLGLTDSVNTARRIADQMLGSVPTSACSSQGIAQSNPGASE